MYECRVGMGIHESVDHGLFKAIFVTGGPGSGKDLVIRESIEGVFGLSQTEIIHHLDVSFMGKDLNQTVITSSLSQTLNNDILFIQHIKSFALCPQ